MRHQHTYTHTRTHTHTRAHTRAFVRNNAKNVAQHFLELILSLYGCEQPKQKRLCLWPTSYTLVNCARERVTLTLRLYTTRARTNNNRPPQRSIDPNMRARAQILLLLLLLLFLPTRNFTLKHTFFSVISTTLFSRCLCAIERLVYFATLACTLVLAGYFLRFVSFCVHFTVFICMCVCAVAP